MFTDLLILAPVGLALGLVAFGRYGDHHAEPTPARVGVIVITAVIVGPVAVDAVGLFVWLMGVAAVVAMITMIAMLRPLSPRRPA